MPGRLKRFIVAGVIVAGLLTTLVGCAPKKSELDGTRWQLSGWTLNSLNPADFTITAEFSGGQISGSGGVNTYGGPYKSGSGNSFSVGELASTMMAGPEPAMRAESAYLTSLAQAGSYKLTGNTLTLYDQAGHELLVFEELN